MLVLANPSCSKRSGNRISKARCDFMELYVERKAQAVLDSINDMFDGRARMTFEELELRVKPVLLTWQIKPKYQRGFFFGNRG